MNVDVECQLLAQSHSQARPKTPELEVVNLLNAHYILIMIFIYVVSLD